MNLVTRFDNHDDFFRYLDTIIADFKLRVAKNHPDLLKCEIHIDLKVIEFKQTDLGKVAASRFDAASKRLN